jgi:hypothetical protein
MQLTSLFRNNPTGQSWVVNSLDPMVTTIGVNNTCASTSPSTLSSDLTKFVENANAAGGKPCIFGRKPEVNAFPNRAVRMVSVWERS